MQLGCPVSQQGKITNVWTLSLLLVVSSSSIFSLYCLFNFQNTIVVMREWSLSSSRLDHCRIMSRYLDGAWWNNWIPHSPVYTDQSKAMCNLADSRQNNLWLQNFILIIYKMWRKCFPNLNVLDSHYARYILWPL